MIDFSAYPNLTAKEFRCKCGCGSDGMDKLFLDTIQSIRTQFGPMEISSGYRCENHPAEKRKREPGAHNAGVACDVSVYGESAWRLLRVAANFPEVRGVGVSQKGDLEKRFIHLDSATDGTRPWIWSY